MRVSGDEVEVVLLEIRVLRFALLHEPESACITSHRTFTPYFCVQGGSISYRTGFVSFTLFRS